jgi:hypothetical protein
MRLNCLQSVRALGRERREWVFLTAFSLPLVSWGAMQPSRPSSAPTDVSSRRFVDPAGYRLWYESHQLYGCDPQKLSVTQAANLRRWCRCVELIQKYAAGGIDQLSNEECALVAEGLSKRYPHLDEYPGYLAITEACRERAMER